MIRIGEELERPFDDEVLQPAENSLFHFCQFVDDYTRYAIDPMSTAAVCEHHAAGIRITRQDVSPETIPLLIETLLNVIDHLEKKWLDEQLRHEELVQREHPVRQHKQPRFNHRSQRWLQGVWQRVVRTPIGHVLKHVVTLF